MIRRLVAVATALIVVVVAAVVALRPHGGPETTAVFTNARGLVPGADVRVGGAVVGSVRKVTLDDRGRALVRFELHDGLEQLRSDATAAIRPTDLLGDVYLSLTPGSASAALSGPIPPARTSNAPRLDELLRTFQPSVRTGLQALLVETGMALDRRGPDLNVAALRLHGALAAADGVMDELGSQNAELRGLVGDAERATRQLAERRRALSTLVGGFSRTLQTTGAHAAAVDRDLQAMPATLAQVRSTGDRLASTAVAATPLARSLGRAAAPLTVASERLSPFLGSATRAVRQTRPLVRSLHTVLRSSPPTTRGLALGLRRLRQAAPDTSKLIHELVPVAPKISEGFFVNFADEAAEPGTQPFDPFADPRRNYWRGAAVLSCESFGLKVAPGCLDRFLAASKGKSKRAAAPGARTAHAAAKPARSAGVLDYLLRP